MKLLVVTVLTIVSVSCQDSKPIYSSRYANVYYQRAETGTRSNNNVKFDLSPKEQEGIYPPATEGTFIESSTGINELNPPLDPDVTTEPDSEQIEFGRRIKIDKKPVPATDSNADRIEFGRRIKENKRTNDKENLELIEELEPTEEPESTKEEVTEPTLTDSVEVLEPKDMSNLNEQGIYYIYHPNGLLQKVLYSTKDDKLNMEYYTQINYQNVAPIVEPIYTYDPNSFVFQRLQFYQ